jgi:transmembrane sensor
MNIHDNISEELLARYLEGSASERENGIVETWLAQSPDHAQELANYRLIWDHSVNLGKRFEVDTDAAWKKVRSQMNKPATPEIKSLPVKKTRPLVWKTWAAAVVTLALLAFGWLTIKKNSDMKSVEIATAAETRELTLPDGSKVVLNFNSSITYPDDFKEARSVTLHGEAYFDVKRDEAHPFLIEANGAQIRVLGTSFNVKAYQNAPVRVDVASGKVQVSTTHKKVELKKGEGTEIVADSLRSFIANMNVMGYGTNVYDFHASNLDDIITSIREGYHVDVRLSNPQIARCRLTIRFENEPLDATLAVIAETLELDLRKEGNVYWLDGNACQ